MLVVSLDKSGQSTSMKTASPDVPADQSDTFTSGTLLVLLTVIIWGIQFPIAKHTFETVNAFHSAVFRFSIPALILITALIIREGRAALNTGKDTLQVIGLGLFGMCAAPSLIFGGLMFTRPR